MIEVTAFEPDEAECERLRREAGALPYPARFLPHALWREVAEGVPFHVANWPVASSIYPPNEEFLRAFPVARALLATKEVRSIATTTLDRVRAEHGVGCDVLKLDVEGAELDVLRGGERRARRGARRWRSRSSSTRCSPGQPLFADVDAHLRAARLDAAGPAADELAARARLDAAESGDGGQIVAADALYLGPAAGERARPASGAEAAGRRCPPTARPTSCSPGFGLRGRSPRALPLEERERA